MDEVLEKIKNLSKEMKREEQFKNVSDLEIIFSIVTVMMVEDLMTPPKNVVPFKKK